MKLNYIYVYLRGDLLLKFKISYINEPAGVRLYSFHRTPVTFNNFILKIRGTLNLTTLF